MPGQMETQEQANFRIATDIMVNEKFFTPAQQERILKFESDVYKYNEPERRIIYACLDLATVAHQENTNENARFRKQNGDEGKKIPYILHPLECAQRLVDDDFDYITVSLMLLHDVAEDVLIDGQKKPEFWYARIENHLNAISDPAMTAGLKSERPGSLIARLLPGLTEIDTPLDGEAEEMLERCVYIKAGKRYINEAFPASADESDVKKQKATDKLYASARSLFRACELGTQGQDEWRILIVKITDIWNNAQTIEHVNPGKIIRMCIAANLAELLGWEQMRSDIIQYASLALNPNTPSRPTPGYPPPSTLIEQVSTLEQSQIAHIIDAVMEIYEDYILDVIRGKLHQLVDQETRQVLASHVIAIRNKLINFETYRNPDSLSTALHSCLSASTFGSDLSLPEFQDQLRTGGYLEFFKNYKLILEALKGVRALNETSMDELVKTISDTLGVDIGWGFPISSWGLKATNLPVPEISIRFSQTPSMFRSPNYSRSRSYSYGSSHLPFMPKKIIRRIHNSGQNRMPYQIGITCGGGKRPADYLRREYSGVYSPEGAPASRLLINPFQPRTQPSTMQVWSLLSSMYEENSLTRDGTLMREGKHFPLIIEVEGENKRTIYCLSHSKLSLSEIMTFAGINPDQFQFVINNKPLGSREITKQLGMRQNMRAGGNFAERVLIIKCTPKGSAN